MVKGCLGEEDNWNWRRLVLLLLWEGHDVISAGGHGLLPAGRGWRGVHGHEVQTFKAFSNIRAIFNTFGQYLKSLCKFDILNIQSECLVFCVKTRG